MKPALDQSTPVWSQLVKAPQDAPNILLVMTDDVGFGASSTFGGPIPTPNLDRLAKQGARYNNFHTTAMCSPGSEEHTSELQSLMRISYAVFCLKKKKTT